MGTTGASDAAHPPIAPDRTLSVANVAHTVVFFIFLVSNIGGCLTPLGDPPLFLGYLRGVPLPGRCPCGRHGWPWWLCCIVVYGVWDIIMHARESPQALQFDRTHIEPLRLQGSINFLFLGAGHYCSRAGSFAMADAPHAGGDRRLSLPRRDRCASREPVHLRPDHRGGSLVSGYLSDL